MPHCHICPVIIMLIGTSGSAANGAALKDGNRGPITTIYTPPVSCFTETTMFSFNAGDSSSTQIFQNHYDWGDASCYPPTITTVAGTEQWGNYYYSPGICPSGWSSACSQAVSPAGLATTLDPDTTAILCCPSYWSCFEGGGWSSHGCTRTLMPGQVLTSVWVYVSGENYEAPFVTPTILPSLTSTTITSSTSALCDGIPVMWQNTDVKILSLLGITPSVSISSTGSASTSLSPSYSNIGTTTQDSTPSTALSTNLITGSTILTSSPSQNTITNYVTPTDGLNSASTNSGQSGYSTSDKIALGVGIGVGIPTLVVTIWMCVLQHMHFVRRT